MNTIWFLCYLAGVVENLRWILAIFGIIGLLVYMKTVLTCLGDEKPVPVKFQIGGVLGVLMLFITSLLPAPSLLKAMAAMDATQLVAATPKDQKGEQVIDAMLNKVIEEGKQK